MVNVRKTNRISPCGENVMVSTGETFPVTSLVGQKFAAITPDGKTMSVVAADAADLKDLPAGTVLVFNND